MCALLLLLRENRGMQCLSHWIMKMKREGLLDAYSVSACAEHLTVFLYIFIKRPEMMLVLIAPPLYLLVLLLVDLGHNYTFPAFLCLRAHCNTNIITSEHYQRDSS